MKRLMIGALACLLLCGCGGPATETTPTTVPQEAVAATEPPGSYLAGSEIEQATAGAVRAYPQNLGEITDLVAVGEDLLVFSGTETTTITRLTGENLFRVAEASLDFLLLPDSPDLYISEEWVIYYDIHTGELVYLDEDLKAFNRLTLPEELEGYPALTVDRKKLYYCTASGVRCMDLETGISRLVKEMTFAIQTMADTLLEDTVLAVCVSDGVGNTETLYLDAQTGALLYSLTEDKSLRSGDGFYYAIDKQGMVDQMIFGRAGEDAFQLTPENYLDSGVFLENAHAAVVETEKGLDYYDLENGLRTASLPLENWQVQYITSGDNGFVYFLRDGTIYRWNLSATSVADETVYTGTRYTREAPDAEGMAICEAYARQLSQTHGLRILIGEEAGGYTTGDYNPVTEYQTAVFVDALAQLEGLLSAFPQGFFETAMAGFSQGELTVCLVRDLVGSYESGRLERTPGIQFWDGERACVSLAMGAELEQTFFQQIFHVLESRVLSETIAYYRWDELNPRDFQYDNDYAANESRDGEKYLRDDATRAFIDTFSMSFAKEDRARIFAYACTEGNESYFLSRTMQKKLKTLCQGIREAYALENYPERLLWEQYLEEPLTP